MSTFTSSDSDTFTLLHARQLASKVGTDLHRFLRFYGEPSATWIDWYEKELATLLNEGAVSSVVYGFQRGGKWTEASVHYTVLNGNLSADDDPGKIRPNLDVANAGFTSFLSYSNAWFGLSAAEREAIESSCPFQRTSGTAPPLESGYWADDLSYASGGRGLGRASVRR